MSDLRSTIYAPLDARFNNFKVFSNKKWPSENPNKEQSAFIVEGDSFFDGRVNITGKLTVGDLIVTGGDGGGGINIPGGEDGYVMISDNTSNMKWRKQYWETNDTPTSVTGPSDNIIHSEYKIGLGITNPSEKLSIDGNVEINNLYIGDTNYDNSSIISNKSLKNFSDYYSIKIEQNTDLKLNTSSSIKFNVNDTEVGVIDNLGNFGIGVTNPQANLHIDGSVIIDGNLTVNGSLTSVNSEVVEIEDPMLFLGKNNPMDMVDMGIVGQYVEGGITKYSGIFRDASGDKSYYNFFHNLEVKPTTTVDTSHPSYEYGNLHVGGLKVDTGITFTSDDAFIYSNDIIFEASEITGTGYVGFGTTSSPEDSVDVQNGIIIRDGQLKIGITDSLASVHINRSDVIVIPVGNINERIDITGGIRYNTDNSSFEGYNGNSWGSLGGLIDVNQNTKITAEDSAGIDNNQLRFFTGYGNDSIQRMIINEDGSIGIGVSSSGNYMLEVDGLIGISGDIYPKEDNSFYLGASIYKWKGIYIGEEGIYIGDSVLKDEYGILTISGPVQIDSLNITNNVDINGLLNVSGISYLNNVNITEDLNVSGNTLLNTLNVINDVDIDGNLDVSGTLKLFNLDVSNNANINNDLMVSGNTNIQNDLMVSGNTNINGAITASSINLSGNGSVNGDLNLVGDITVEGNGTFNSLNITNDVDIDGNLDVSGTLTLYDISVTNNLYITNTAYINESLYVTGNTFIKNNLNVENNSQLESLNVTNNVDIDGTLDVAGNSQLESLNVTNDVDIDGTLDVAGNSQLESLNVTNDVDIDGSLNVSGNINIYNLYVSNNAYITNNLNVTGNTQLESLNVTNDTNLNGSLNVTGTSSYYGGINSYNNINLYSQIGDFAGSILTSEESSFNNKVVIQSNRGFGGIIFKTNPDGDLETAMFIDSEGNIGIGVTNQTEKLEVLGNTRLYGNLDVTGNTNIEGLLKVTGNTDLDGTLNVEGDTIIQSTLDVQNATKLESLTVTNDSNLLGNLNVEGNLTVQGTTTTVNSEIVTIEDPLLHLASNNINDTIDFGFYGKYVKPHPLIVGVDITYYSGLARDATDGCYMLFETRTEPTTIIDTSLSNFSYSCLKIKNLNTTDINVSNNLNVSGNTKLNLLNVTNDVNIDGSLDVAGNSQLESLNVTNNVDIDGTLDVKGNSQLESLNVTNNVDIDGTLDVAGNSQLESLNVTNDVDIDGTLDVAGNSQLESLNVTNNVDIDGTLNVAGNSQLESLNVTNDVDIDGSLNVSGNINIYNLYVSNNAYVNNDLYITNNTTIQGNLLVTDSVTLKNDLNVANNTLYVNSNTNTISINSTSTDISLYISGTDGLVIPVGDNSERVDITGAIRYNSETQQFEGYSGTWGSLGGIKDVDQDTYISAENNPGDDNDQLKFYTAGSEKMVIDTNGNVGIGITNPNNKLHIFTKDSFSYINVDRGNTNSDSGIRFQDNGTDEWVIWSNGSNGDFNINEGTHTNRLKIKTGGYVGIGVSNPLYPLDITGDNQSNISSLSLRNGNNVSTFNDGAQIRFGWDGTDNYAHFIHTRHNSGGINNAIDFYVNDGTANNTVTNGSIYSMTINDGNLGIGITNPTNKLDVIGDAYVSQFLGVGIQNINYPLHVETTNNNSWSTKIQNNNASLYALHTNGNALNIHSGISNSSSYLMKLRNNTYSDIFTVLNDGNVGISISSPSVKLDVSAGLNDGAIIGESFIGNHIDTNNQFIISHKSLKNNSNDYSLKQNINGQTNINSKSGQDLKLNINDTNHIIVKSDGKVGIHTTLPNENIEIKDNVLIDTTSNVSLTVTNTLSNIFIAHFDGNGIYVESGTTLNKALDLNENNNDLFTVYNNGDVVIGITQGDNKLSIQDGLSILNDNDSLNINVTDNQNIISSMNEINLNVSSNEILNIKKDYVNINGELDQQELNISGSVYITDSLYIGVTDSPFKLHVSGDTKFDGDVVIGGILSFEGVSIDGLEFQDSLIKLGNNNTDNTEDIGFYGKYVDSGVTKYTGLYSDASDNNNFKLFKDLEVDPMKIVNDSHISYTYADLSLNNLYTEGKIGIGITNPSVQLHISGTDGLVIPVGNITERVDITGAIRYNSETQQFEGYSGTWGSLGGVIDVNQDTYISAENSPGENNDQLKFFTFGTQKMIIDNNGYIGMGITNPVTSLHISSNNTLVIPVGNITERIDVTGGIRYNIDTLSFEGYNGSTWGSLGGVKDVDGDTYISAENTPGSDNDELKFYTAGIEHMRIDNNGNIGIGITNPQYALDVDGIIQSNDEIFAPEFTATSDIRVKENIKRFNQQFLQKLCQLNLFEYNFISEYSKNNETMYGLLAQNVEQIIPEAVKTKKVKVNDKNIDDFKTISQNTLITYLIGSIQQLTKSHNTLLNEFNNLKTDYSKLRYNYELESELNNYKNK